MINARHAAALATAVALSFATPMAAMAGPLEDGVQAYNHAEYPKALRILQPLADRGNADAQYTLALMHLRGQGVSESKVQAHLYFDLVARSGDADAAADRNKLENDMKPDEVAEAKRLEAEWKSK